MKRVMTHFQKQTIKSVLTWVSSNFFQKPHFSSSKTPLGSIYISHNPRLYRTKRLVLTDGSVSELSDTARREAQAALLDYLHSTRSIQFTLAEHMSRNSPHFLEKLFKRVEITAGEVEWCIKRHLCYHPINEFEPFFESLGLKPSEYGSFLPHDLMFLTDDELLLENYRVLCNYGIARSKIGKIYKEAPEVVRCGYGVMQSKLEAYENLGLSQSFVGKIIFYSPYLLIDDVNEKFVEVLVLLKKAGIELSWFEDQLLEDDSYDWSVILNTLSLFSKIGFSEEQLGGLIRQNVSLILEDSGYLAHKMIGFLLKFGATSNDIRLIFLQFPQIHVRKAFMNLKECVAFMFHIEMRTDEIGKIICSHAMFMATLTLLKPNTIMSYLSAGKKRIREHLLEDPLNMKKWVWGAKVEPLPGTGEKERSKLMKTKFLIDMGYAENSIEMEKAFKVFKGRGGDLQERFDCIVNAGLDRKVVRRMVRVSPQILNQRRSVIETKIDFLVNGLGYPVSYLTDFPSYLDYRRERVKLRLCMYNWLKEKGAAEPNLAMCTVISCTTKLFMQRYVSQHPEGPQVWKNLMQQIYSE